MKYAHLFLKDSDYARKVKDGGRHPERVVTHHLCDTPEQAKANHPGIHAFFALCEVEVGQTAGGVTDVTAVRIVEGI
jgi:hypothetical protein